jgi:subtilisin family serine protease
MLVLFAGATPAPAPTIAPPVVMRVPVQSIVRSMPRRGIGTRLARRIREDGATTVQPFIASGLSREDVLRERGAVSAQIGPILAGRLTGEALLRLASSADLVEAPQSLHPLLDVSRVAVGADRLDEGKNLPQRYRGKGVLIAAYDSGVDLLHPDLRELDGPSRVVALWDQTMSGTPPSGHTTGNACTSAELAMDQCASTDSLGHGTHVFGVAASNGPRYRGIAPEAGLVVARSSAFDTLVETLGWFDEVATAKAQPMVVNLSVGGHQGPHDGTSLEAQAIDAYRHLVVAASGNEGATPVHAFAALADSTALAVVRFAATSPGEQSVVIDIWGDGQKPLVVQALVMQKDGTVLAKSSTISVGSMGRTDALQAGSGMLGTVGLDAEAGPNAFNGKSHLTIAADLHDWQDAPAGKGYLVVRMTGEGRVDLWVDSPPMQGALASFDKDNVLGSMQEIAGDISNSISDPATAVAAIAVAAYTDRVMFPSANGTLMTGGTIGTIATFCSFGPTLAPDKTGPKPDIAAPGAVVVAARSRSAPADDSGAVSALYRASAGTSVSTPHVAGTAALILSAKPSATKEELKQYILRTATRDSDVDARDSRWGAGKLDAARAVEGAVGTSEGCGCGTVLAGRGSGAMALILGLALAWSTRRRT